MYRNLLFVSSFLLLAGCDSTQMQQKTDSAVGESTQAALAGSEKSWVSDASAADVQVAWIDSFGDETLVRLVKEAQENNRDLQAAAANVERSLALAKQAGAALVPSVSLTGSGSRSGGFEGSSADRTGLSVGAQVDWELDLWGRVRSGAMASASSAEAAQADFLYTQFSIAAATAKTYFTAIEVGLQLEIAQKNLDIAEETLRIATVKFENGVTSSQDLALARSDVATAKESLASIEGSQRNTARSLELLLGRYPSAELKVRATLPEVPPVPPAGIPSEILERRPDLIAAERRVASAFNAAHQAKAARLPSIGLSGSAGGSSSSLSDLLDPSNMAWSLGSSLLAPLFDGGLRQAQLDAASADQKAAVASYAQAAFTAFQEVESTLDQGAVLVERIEQLSLAAEESAEAFRIAEVQYKEGAIELLDLLNFQRRLISAESNVVSLERLLLEQRVNLHLALGGDWK